MRRLMNDCREIWREVEHACREAKRMSSAPDTESAVKLVALYLLTTPESSVIGVWHCPIDQIAIKTGLTREKVVVALGCLCEADFLKFDLADKTVFVKKMLRYQLGNKKISNSMLQNVQIMYHKIGSPLIKESFFKAYGEQYGLQAPEPLRERLQMSRRLKIDRGFLWSDKTINGAVEIAKSLDALDCVDHIRCLALYFLTAQESNAIGIWHCPPEAVAQETGISKKVVEFAIACLGEAGFLTYNLISRHVFVHKAAYLQFGESVVKGSNEHAEIESLISAVQCAASQQKFLDLYGDSYHLRKDVADECSGGLSFGCEHLVSVPVEAVTHMLRLYFMDASKPNMIGVWRCPKNDIAKATKLGLEHVDLGIGNLERDGFLLYDEGSMTVFVFDALTSNIGKKINPKDNRVKGVQNLYEKIHSREIKNAFYRKCGASHGLQKPKEAGSSPSCINYEIIKSVRFENV